MPRPIGLPALSIAPPALADKLRAALPLWAMGLEEPGLARHLALAALSATDADLRASGAGLALWAWQRAPFDAQRLEPLRAALAANPGDKPALDPATAFAEALAARLAPDLNRSDPGRPDPELAEALPYLLAGAERAAALRLLLTSLRNPQHGLAWLAPAWEGLLRLESGELATAALESCAWPPELSPLRARLAAEVAFLHGPAEAALSALDAVSPRLFGAWAASLRAELLLRLGEPAGLALLSELYSAMPWHTHLGLKLHDALNPPPVAGPEALSRAVILVYSWNKADLVRQTLASLARTDAIGAGHGAGARILALDNGSDDGTGQAMREAAALFPPGSLRVISLPVNIGAPAARNWLLAQPEVQASDYAVFLDDDVLLPERWLLRLLGALEAAPRAGAAGCRIVSATPPPCLQSADYQLFAPQNRPRSFRELPENVSVFDNCAGALDFGLFTYARPAAHVSGCCHALRVDVLRALGGFDIRFSPTQFDDLDRDLRSAVAGHPAVYAGDVAIAHVQHSSLAKAKSDAATGQVMGNKIKLEGKHAHADMDRVFRSGLDALWDDLRAKWERLPPQAPAQL